MVSFHPFSPLRPIHGKESEIAAPPYDVVDRKEARAFVQDKPNSLLRISRADGLFDDSVDAYDDQVYALAQKNFQRLIDEGLLERSSKASFFVYEQQMGNHKQFGLVGLANAQEYWAGKIKKHEFTLPKKEDDRYRLTQTLKAHLGPVFLTYHPQVKIDQIVHQITSQAPEVNFSANDGLVTIEHRVWPISDDAIIAEIQEAFSQIDAFYIADGHHRAAAASRIGKDADPQSSRANFLAVAFPSNQLQILPYQRLLLDLNGHSQTQLLTKLSTMFDCYPLDQAQAPKQSLHYTMCLAGKWYLLVPQAHLIETLKTQPKTQQLAVSLLQNQVLAPIFDIQNPRTSDRIQFIGGIRGLKALEEGAIEKQSVAFALYPTSINELIEIADMNEVMPPKSTWFEPKLRSGLMISTFE